MTKLKLGPIPDNKPVKLTLELTATLHCDLIAYGEVLGRDAGNDAVEPTRLIVSMLERFITTDRRFAKVRHGESGNGRVWDSRG